jgi:hypothetical protein
MSIDAQWLNTVLACLIFVGSAVITIVRITIIVTKALEQNKAEFNALLDLKSAEMNGKMDKFWERFDEYKNTVDGTFIRKETCGLTHANSSREFLELNHKFDKIEQKIDTYIQALITKGGQRD